MGYVGGRAGDGHRPVCWSISHTEPQSAAQQDLRELLARVGWYSPCWTSVRLHKMPPWILKYPVAASQFSALPTRLSKLFTVQTPLQTCTDLIPIHAWLITSQGCSSDHAPLLAAPLQEPGQDPVSPRLHGVVPAVHPGMASSRQ